MTGEEYFVVNLTSRPWKIIEKYPDFEAYRKDIIPARYGERETFSFPLILFNLRKFEAENLFEFFPDLKLSEIHHILTKENKGE